MKIYIVIRGDACAADELEMAFSKLEDAEKYVEDFERIDHKYSWMQIVDIELTE